MNKALLDTDIYSEVLKAINPTVAQSAATYYPGKEVPYAAAY